MGRSTSDGPAPRALDRRANDRRSISLGAVVANGKIETVARTVDFSSDGLLLKSEWSWMPGTLVTVRLQLTDGTCVAARAEVRRCAPEGMAVQLRSRTPGFDRVVAALEGGAGC